MSQRGRFQASLEKAQPKAGAGPDWAMTFADTMSLLMGFFALLISFSTFDEARFKRVAGGVNEVFGGSTKSPAPESIAAIRSGESGDRPIAEPAPLSSQALRGAIDGWGRQTQGGMALKTYESYRGVEVDLQAADAFEAGTDRLTPHAEGLARFLAGELGRTARDRKLLVEVRVAGAPSAPQFEDAWALAMGRAEALGRRIAQGAGGVESMRVVPSAVSVKGGRPSADVTFVFERPEVQAE